MALAHLAYAGRQEGQVVFDADLGSVNRYFQVAVGGETRRNAERGFTMLVDPSWVSPVRGPIPESRMGRIQIGIPEALFDQENRNVQLKTFRDQELNGPAVSDVLTAWSGGSDRLPSMTFALEAEAEQRCRDMTAKPYRFAPEKPLSEAMFLDALLNALPGVLPAIGGLLGGAKKDKAAGGSPLDAVLGVLGSKEIQELLKQLVGQIATAKSHASHRSLAIAQSDGPGYARQSRAMMAPLLAALPALMPLLKNVLTPETIKAVLGAADPSKVIGAVTGGLKDLAGAGIENQKLILDHLKAVHPSLDDKDLMGLLASMSAPSQSARRGAAKFERTTKVQLELLAAPALTIDGQARTLYQLGKTLRFPFAVHTPRAIDGAEIDVVLRNMATRKVVARKRGTVTIAGSGPVARVPSFDASAVSDVASGTDCTLTITMTWKAAHGRRVGTSITQWITLVRSAVITDVKRVSEPKALDDVTRYREFWHKIWQGPFDEARRRVELQIKYCYCFDPGARENSRMETKALLEEPQNGRSAGKLKTGLLLSAVALNALLPRAFQQAPLAPEDLEAFEGQGAADRFATTAQARVVLSSPRSRGSAAAWVYPDVALHEVVLRAPDQVDDNGQVLSTSERTATFPLPVAAHFIGTRSGQ